MQAVWQDVRLAGRLVSLRQIPLRNLTFASASALAGLALGIVQGWPLWLIGLAFALPWLVFVTSETVHTGRTYGWLALFYGLAVLQSGHVIEHTAQMVQIHLLELSPPHNHGIFGMLDIEWVHFGWNSMVLAAMLLLLWRFPGNRWLLVAAVFAMWHQVEHSIIMTRFLTSGEPGAPGLLAMGGHLGGGLPLTRADLHFFYNLFETTPMLIAYLWQVRRTLYPR